MAFLINRTAAARIECLHALAKMISAKFGTSRSFRLNAVKFDRNDPNNVYSFCTLLRNNPSLGLDYCMFKENPLDDAGCSITNGVESDSTKSKEVSNTINAMHALGFVQRTGNSIKLTPFGEEFANAAYGTDHMLDIISRAVLNYGPIVGILTKLADQYNEGDEFNADLVDIGYPSTSEFVNYNGSLVELSTGSTNDSKTRIRSCIIAWLITAGYIKPANKKLPISPSPLPHMAYRNYINSPHRMEQRFVLGRIPTMTITERPLSYDNLTKLNSALRENGQKLVREATMLFESKIKNRRFAILYLLNNAYQTNTIISIDDIIDFLRNEPDKFIVSEDHLEDTILAEIGIAETAGIPFKIVQQDSKYYLKPMTGLNLDELSIGAPTDVIDYLNNNN